MATGRFGLFGVRTGGRGRDAFQGRTVRAEQARTGIGRGCRSASWRGVMAFTDGRSGRRWRRRCRGPSVRRGPGRHRSSARTGRSSKRGLRPTAMRRAGSLTPPSGSGGGWSTSIAPTSPKRRCATTCVRASGRLAGRWPRCSCLRCLKPATDAALDERAQRAVRTQPPGEATLPRPAREAALQRGCRFAAAR
jgi:hypothetical protein